MQPREALQVRAAAGSVRQGVRWTVGLLVAAPLPIFGGYCILWFLRGFPGRTPILVLGLLALIAWAAIGVRALQVSLRRPES